MAQHERAGHTAYNLLTIINLCCDVFRCSLVQISGGNSSLRVSSCCCHKVHLSPAFQPHSHFFIAIPYLSTRRPQTSSPPPVTSLPHPATPSCPAVTSSSHSHHLTVPTHLFPLCPLSPAVLIPASFHQSVPDCQSIMFLCAFAFKPPVGSYIPSIDQ